MFGFYVPFWMYAKHPDSMVSSPVKFIRQEYVDFGDRPNSAEAVIYEEGENQYAEIRIPDHGGRWKTVFRRKFAKYSDTNILQHYWEVINKKAVVIKNTSGSGANLSYIVLVKDNDSIVPLFEKSDLFQGDVWFEGNELIEAIGNRYHVLKMSQGKLTSIPYRIPSIPGAKVIQYSISPQGIVNIKNLDFRAKVGDIIQLIRKDDNNVTERILYMNGSQNIEDIPHRSAFKIKEKGPIEIEIIPFGYDWDKAKQIRIDVK